MDRFSHGVCVGRVDGSAPDYSPHGRQRSGALLFGGSARAGFVACFSAAVFFDVGAGCVGVVLSGSRSSFSGFFNGGSLALDGFCVRFSPSSRR